MDEATNKTFTLDLSRMKKLKEFVTCQKCNNLLKNPIEILTCEHLFCSSCVTPKYCPKCNTSYSDQDVKEADVYTLRILNLVQKYDTKFASTNYKIEGIPVDIFKNVKLTDDDKCDDDESICIKIKWDREGEYICPQICEFTPIKKVKYNMKRNPKGETPLHLACKKGDFLKVLELIEMGVDLNITDWANWTPLHEAVLSNSVNCVQILLSKGALVNICGEHYSTPLHQAIGLENEEIIKLLLKYGADKNAEDCTGLSVINIETNASVRDVLESTEKLETLPKQFLYYEQHSTIFMLDIKDQMKTKLYKNMYTFTKNPESKDIYLCMLADAVCLTQLNVLRFVANGIMIIKENDLSEYLISKVPYIPKLIPEQIRPGLLRSIKFHLEKKPKLFDGMNFHVSDHQKPVKIQGGLYTKTELETLIKSAGGNILIRAPAERTSTEMHFRPYHSKHCDILKKCCNFIVYEQNDQPMLLYNMPELRHVTSDWVVRCVMNYQIAYP